jgi:cell wall-associated NlpC family hydrolase
MSGMPVAVFRQWIVICITSAVLAGCGHEQVRRLPDDSAGTAVPVRAGKSAGRPAGERAASVALGQLGVPYRYGGTTSRGFDCSGLVQYAWHRAGSSIPRTTTEQWKQLAKVRSSDLQIGDLLFFRIDGRVSHVGLYLGDRRFVHAPASGRSVSVASLDSGFYRQKFVGGARP